MRPHPWLVVVLVGALIGLVFAGLSTYDFVQHLDRQVHTLHCSFVPGGKAHGASGCQVAMMSEYSSVMRGRVWGGVPIALPAMAVFAFIGCFAVDLLLTRRKDDRRATAFLALAAGLPAGVSLIMLVISLTRLGTTCTMCVSIYIASALCLAGGIGLWRRAVRLGRGGGGPPIERGGAPADGRALAPSAGGPAASNRFLGAAFGAGVGFVALPVLVYLALAPDHGRFVGTCGALAKPEDTYGVMVRVGHERGRVPALEILDPLCPACAAFEERLASSGLVGELDRKAILFPLDNTCNWMVTEATHPGACAVSEAVLCAGDRAPDVIAWAYEEQARIRAETKRDPGAAARIVGQRFPELRACVGSPEARSRLNKSLRWAVANNLHVLTPQLFVDGVKLCDEDVDLGLAYSLRVMLERHAAGTLAAPGSGAGKPAEALAPGAGAGKPPAPGAGTGKPADSGAHKGKPAADKPAADKPAQPAEPPAGAAADKAAADKPADPPADKPAAPADQPITSPSQVPGAATEGGTR